MLIFILLLKLGTVVCMDAMMKDLVTPLQEIGEACGYMSCPKYEKGAINVHIVPHTHGELGYTNTFYGHYTGYDDVYDKTRINMKNILDATITELWANENRKFTFSDFPYFFHWWKNRDATVRRMVFQLLRQGRLYFVGGSWGMSDEATTSYHAVIDLFTYGLRKLNATFLDCGRPLVSWQADAFGHSREFASLMAQMGFDGHFINPISFDDELERMRTKSLEFVWRGSDDLGPESDIYTHKLFDGYWSPPGFCFGGLCDDPLIVTSDSQFLNVKDRVDEFIRSVKKRQAPFYTTKNIMVIMGRRYGYYDAKTWFGNIDNLIHYVNSKQQDVKEKILLYYSTPACYLRAVHNESPKLPNKQDDFLPLAYNKDSHASGMYTSRPAVKHRAREMHRYVQMAKQLQVLASLGNNDKIFEDMMWTAGVLQDHNIISGAMREHVVTYYEKKFLLGKLAAQDIYKQAFNKLRKSPNKDGYHICRFGMSSCLPLDGDWFYLVVYNPLAWSVTIPVRLPVRRGEFIVYDPQGAILDAVLMRIPKRVRSMPGRNTDVWHELVFFAEDIPPLGYKSYFVNSIIRRYKRSPIIDVVKNIGTKGNTKHRYERSLIMKLNKNKKKKYITRQTNMKYDDKLLLNDEIDLIEPEYEYFDEDTTTVAAITKIVFGDVSRRKDKNDDVSVLTPRPKVVTTSKVAATDKSSNVTEGTIVNTTEAIGNLTVHGVGTPLPVTAAPCSSLHRNMQQAATKSKLLTRLLTSPESTTWATEKSEFTEDVDDNDDLDDETTTSTTTTTPPFDYSAYSRKMADNSYFNVLSNDTFIKNKYIQVNIDSNRQISNMVLSNGVNISLQIQFLYYAADDPEKLGSDRRQPGVYIFRPMDPRPVLINENIDTEVRKSSLVEEIHANYSDYASLTLRIYKDMPTVELDWVVGPIPDHDGLGKDVFIRYATDLDNKDVFYTDSNGRQTIKRIRDARATYTPVNDDRIPGNIFPVTSKIYIEDIQKNIRLSIFNDRSQGGTCLNNVQIDLMLHRRIFTDDSGIQAYINETAYGKGLMVRGKHYLYLTKAKYKPNRIFEKKFAKELELGPFVFTSTLYTPMKGDLKGWLRYKNEFSGLTKKLPIGVHILTLEKWSDKILLRLENYLEKTDVIKTGIKRVFIKDIFSGFKITDARETYLGANIWLDEMNPIKWNTGPFYKSFNEAYGNTSSAGETSDDSNKFVDKLDLDNGIYLTPQQIRTFVVSYVYR